MCTQPKEVIPELIFLLLSKIGSTEKGKVHDSNRSRVVLRDIGAST